jgi:oxygen-independent coproporphyrinogen-3 oxidase
MKKDNCTNRKKLLLKNGYHEIGMDHFALETDSLYTAKNGDLHRNFMGYSF